jgi:hypothetical protein
MRSQRRSPANSGPKLRNLASSISRGARSAIHMDVSRRPKPPAR